MHDKICTQLNTNHVQTQTCTHSFLHANTHTVLPLSPSHTHTHAHTISEYRTGLANISGVASSCSFFLVVVVVMVRQKRGRIKCLFKNILLSLVVVLLGYCCVHAGGLGFRSLEVVVEPGAFDSLRKLSLQKWTNEEGEQKMREKNREITVRLLSS